LLESVLRHDVQDTLTPDGSVDKGTISAHIVVENRWAAWGWLRDRVASRKPQKYYSLNAPVFPILVAVGMMFASAYLGQMRWLFTFAKFAGAFVLVLIVYLGRALRERS